jgi:uncharacterized glyoxalase superfamily protein PhnB
MYVARQRSTSVAALSPSQSRRSGVAACARTALPVDDRGQLLHHGAMIGWFARPVLHVADVAASLGFYMGRLGFTNPWRHEEAGQLLVAQVDRQGCALILSSQWPDKVGKGLMFVSLNVEPESYEARVAALDALRAELEARGVAVKDGSWGYRLLVVDDPDGNQLYFNYPNDPA